MSDSTNEYTLSSVEEAIQAIKEGRMVIVADNEDRENEGDLVCAAEKITPEMINFMATEARGLICMPVSKQIASRLGLDLMTYNTNDSKQTAFTISIDGVEERGVGTGISAPDRALTILMCMDPTTTAADFRRPGHIFPLIAKDGGVLERTGQTEASVDLAKLAGFKPGGVICEILNPDGSMSRRNELCEFSKKFNIPFITVEQLVDYRLQQELAVTREAIADLPTRYGNFKVYSYIEKISGKEHLALCYGNWEDIDNVLVRAHSECLTGDVFGSLRCDCNSQLNSALASIVEAGAGILLYLKQEGRGIGLSNKIKAYALQDQGMDTYEANRELGFDDDCREYWVGAHILKDLRVNSVKLMTNNPSKIEDFKKYGIKVSERIPLVIINDFNKDYLDAKKQQHNHLIV
ncbi:MAG: 3,4-dihydroxy-2-butanone-4-phosphate synthase [Candidatus Caenarcaniphilales bacterium]|nr:3,4-dihydroxy-2-butanone-4-phosphate synthase [Candidatus Caenarcaniphilales bacterium]